MLPSSTQRSLMALVAAFAVCCGRTTHEPSPLLPSATIGPAGGTLVVDATESQVLAGTSLTVPAGALASPVTISISSSAQSVAQGTDVAAGPVIDLAPDGTRFAVPVTITLPVQVPAGSLASNLRIEAVEANGDARPIAIGSQAGGFATFQTDRFTRFGGVIPRAPDGGAHCESDADCSCALCTQGQCQGVVCNCPEVPAGCSTSGPGPCCCPVPCDAGGGACSSSADCSASDFCAQPSCSASGSCMPRPQSCPADCSLPELCGCDGERYCNGCLANSAGTSVSRDGSACGPSVDAGHPVCTANAQCPPGSFCATSTCGGLGLCWPKPDVCPLICAWPELCGCDGETYCSECMANEAGTNVSNDGSACGSRLTWYTTCGYPLCSGSYSPDAGDRGPDGGLCPAVGESCSTIGSTCGTRSDANCGVTEVCASSDPKLGGCPISSRRFKRDIDYLQQPALERLHDQIVGTRLATFHYLPTAGDPAPLRLGFIIEDQPGSPAVDAVRSGVDLYSYLGMIVATTQVQEREIRDLRQRLEEQKRRR